MIEKIKRLDNEVQLSMLADFEEFQHTQVKLHLSGARKRVPAEIEGTSRQRKCATAVRVEAGQRIDRPAASDYQNRSRFNVSEQLGDQSRGLLALFLIGER